MQNCLTKAWMLGGRHSPGVHNVVAPSSGGLSAGGGQRHVVVEGGRIRGLRLFLRHDRLGTGACRLRECSAPGSNGAFSRH